MGRRALSAALIGWRARLGRRAASCWRAGLLVPLVMLAALVFGACLGQRSDLATPEPLRPTSTRAAGPEPTAAAVIDANPATLLARAVCWYEDPARAASCVPPPQDVLDAIAAMGASRDRRFVAPLVDMRAVDVGWGAEVDAALEQLTGERHDAQADWHRWLGVHPGALPPGYLQWKGRLLGISDATFTRVLGGAPREEVRPELLAWTGLRVGELPSLIAPRAANTANHGYLESDDVVYGLQLGGALRAYPQRLLSWHPIVHDLVGGAGVLVTYCGPCRSAAAFTPSIGGRALQFQDAGLWLDGRPLMVDEQTGSLWDAVSGRAILGTMAATQAQLPRVGLVTLRWEEWAAEHPSTAVLALDTGFVRDYSGAAQRARDASLAARFPASAPVDGRLPRETRVIGVAAGNEVRAYVLAEVQARRTLLDTVGGERVLLLAQGPGRPVRVFRPGALDLRAYHDDESAEGSDGREGERWWVREGGIVSQLDGRVHEVGAWAETSWEAWSGAHPGASLWGH